MMTSNRKSPDMMEQIDENLRRVYRDVAAKDDVPDRFKALLEKLRDQEKPND